MGEILPRMLPVLPVEITDWLASRAMLNGQNSRRQDLLYYDEMFTDGLGTLVLSGDIAVVYLTAIKIFTIRLNFLWADKTVMCSIVLWVGGWLCLELGLIVIPRHKSRFWVEKARRKHQNKNRF